MPAPADRSVRSHRAAARLAVAGRVDMRRSEAAVAACVAAWTGRPATDPSVVTAAERERVLRRFDEVAARWSALPDGGALTFDWPVPPVPAAGRRVSGRRTAPTRRRAPR